ncbi:D-alanyl-D-alanine carboxypeptidase [Pontibacter ummariensis]|uniref:D-alanyl-D-alanine carboxypeptidase n=1 Tax=Pontibacter ummariensis TaxID=1610492 RepID=A0A239DBK3_9BACT|nr:serine hydrolase domain-containing protein [Pontibacter ummariensis]PRY14343.1 D-alanyl-D-alanine carboxypeptidase [Pontibacter ummariensis]SNS29699.1 D-alanyl-D-alanine carboxypeptidase [Pontibacter ummariensis]
MKHLLLSLVLLLLASGARAVAAGPAPKALIARRLQLKLDSLQRANGFPGVTFAAVLPNGEEILLASGMADSALHIPMKPTHRMLSGSNGKTLFSAVAMVLAEQGLFNLDDKIEKHISVVPWFDRIPNARSITMRMLMNHTSGIEEYYELGDFMQKLKEVPSRTWTPKESFSYVFDREPLFVAGAGWGYADTNYLLLGYILERLSGRTMYDLAKTHVLAPYKLKDTEPSVKQRFDRLAVGYSSPASPFPFHGAVAKNGKLVFSPQFEWTGGGFVSSAADLAAWAKGLYYLKAVSPERRAAMREGVKANTGKDHLYGLGMQIRPGGEAGFGYGHSGWFPGYLTDAEYFPDLDLALAIQFNTDDMRLLKRSTHDYLLELAKVIRTTQSENKKGS